MSPKLRRWLVPGFPFMVSLALSISTVGPHVFWQDSGLFLVAIREMAPLYPPGHVLYQVLCKSWTLLFFFMDFTLAVHLFSSVCAALAAGTLAVAARELLTSSGRIVGSKEEQGLWIDRAAMASGALAAAGYTFWFTGIYAKGYSLYYLVLSQLLLRMIRADASESRKDFLLLAALIGLSWAAHPSATLLGVAFLAFVVAHRKAAGARTIAIGVAVAAAGALGPSLLLPILASRGSEVALGNPADLEGCLSYLVGTRFSSIPGVWGIDPHRIASFGQYLWEEMLGIGLLMVIFGLIRWSQSNRRLLGCLLLWMVPYVAVTILFKIEGQHDCWFVAAWMPLYLVIAAGFLEVFRLARRGAELALGAALTAALGWAITVNLPLLDQSRNLLPRAYGESLLANLDDGALLLAFGDDSLAISRWLQRVKNYRRDVQVVDGSLLISAIAGWEEWYAERLSPATLGMTPFDLNALRRSAPLGDYDSILAAVLNRAADGKRPLFTLSIPPASLIRKDRQIVTAGPIWKLVPRVTVSHDPKYWRMPVEPEEVIARMGRERGIHVVYDSREVRVSPISYERRLLLLLLQAKRNLADVYFGQGEFAACVPLYESIMRMDPEQGRDAGLILSLARACRRVGDRDRSDHLLRLLLGSRTLSNPLRREVQKEIDEK